MAERLRFGRVGEVEGVKAQPAHAAETDPAARLDWLGQHDRVARSHPAGAVARARVGQIGRLAVLVAQPLPRHADLRHEFGVGGVRHIPDLITGRIKIVGIFGQRIAVVGRRRQQHIFAAPPGRRIERARPLLLADRRIGMLIVGGARRDQIPLVGGRAVHHEHLETLERVVIALRRDLVWLAQLVVHQAKTPDLVGCDEHIASQLLAPCDRDPAEIIGDRRRVPIFAGALAAPHAALRPHDLGLARIGHVHDPQIIAVMGIKIPLAVEIDDAGPRMPRRRHAGVETDHLDIFGVAVLIPMVELTRKIGCVGGQRGGDGVAEGAGRRVHAIIDVGLGRRWRVFGRRLMPRLQLGIDDVDRARRVPALTTRRCQHGGIEQPRNDRRAAADDPVCAFHRRPPVSSIADSMVPARRQKRNRAVTP